MGSRLCSAANIPLDLSIPRRVSALWFRARPSSRFLTISNPSSFRVLVPSAGDLMPADGNGLIQPNIAGARKAHARAGVFLLPPSASESRRGGWPQPVHLILMSTNPREPIASGFDDGARTNNRANEWKEGADANCMSI
jgi:hypothetical protein